MTLPFIYRPEYQTRPAGKQLPDNMFSELPIETHLLHLMTLFLVYGKRTEKKISNASARNTNSRHPIAEKVSNTCQETAT